MAKEDAIIIGADVRPLERAEINANKIFKKLEKAARDYARTLSQENKLLEGNIATVKARTKAGHELSVTYKKAYKNIILQTAAYKDNTAAVKKNYEAKLAKAQNVMMKELAMARKVSDERERLSARAELRNNKLAKQQIDQFGKVGVAGKKAANELILSWKTFERIILIQMIRRTFHRLLSALRQSIALTQDFHKAIVEIRTIAQDNQGTFSQWEQSLLRVSNAWGIDLIDAANARYQILSNQVAKGTAQTEAFSNAVFAFSKVTKSTAEDSVNLLTAAINAYGKSSEDVEKVAATMFKTIELGRVRASEMANVLGNAVVPAAQLGISLEELMGSIEIMTIQGIKANTAMTLMRNIILKLNKPTTEMKNLLAEYNAISGEHLVAMHGWAGVLKIVAKESQGLGSELAELFGRIRPTMGMAALIKSFDNVKNAISATEQAGESYKNALEDQFQTPGEKLSRQLNLIRNRFMETYGSTTVEALVAVGEAFGGTKENADAAGEATWGLAKAFEFFLAKGLSLGAAGGVIWLVSRLPGLIRKFTKAVMVSKVQMTALGVAAETTAFSLKAVFATAGPLALVVVLGLIIEKMIKASLEAKALSKNIRENNKEIRKLYEATRKEIEISANFDEANEALRKALKTLGEKKGVLDISSKILEGFKKGLESSLKATEKILKKQGSEVASYYRNAFSVLQDNVKSLNDQIEDSQAKIKSFSETIEEKIFTLKLEDKDVTGQLEQITGRIAELYTTLKSGKISQEEAFKIANRIAELTIKAGEIRKGSTEDAKKSEEDILKTKEKIKEIEKTIAQKRQDIREKAAEEKSTKTLERSLEKLLAKRQKAMKKLQTLQSEMAPVYENINAQTIKSLESLKNAMVTIQKDHEAVLTAELKSTEEKIKSLVTSLSDTLKSLSPEIFKAIGGALQNTLDELTQKSAKMVEEAIATGDFSTFFKSIEGTADAFEKMTGFKDSIEIMFNNMAEKAATTEQSIKNALSYSKQLKTEEAEAQKEVTRLEGLTETDVKNMIENVRNLQAALKAGGLLGDPLGPLVEQIERYARMGGETLLKELPNILHQVNASYQKLIAGRNQFLSEQELTDLNLSMDNIILSAKTFKFHMEGLVTANENLVSVKTRIDENTAALNNLAATSGSTASKVISDTANMISRFNVLTSSIWNAVRAIEVLNTKQAGAEYNSKGKVKYYAKGMARGTDTISAMLTPGEAVINARATAKNLARLVPMNYALNDSRFTRSGTTTNVGDITVNVSGRDSAKLTARDIGRELKREIKRGTLSL